VDLMHVLFGSILAVDDAALLLVAGVASVTLLVLAAAYRPLLVESFDPGFLRSVGGHGARCISSSWCWWWPTWSPASRPWAH
jgi:zinc/manganese transport system permease protein